MNNNIPYLRILFWLTPPVLALALYGPTLTLPFFWDDVPNFQFIFGRPITEILVASPNFPYYRPLTFVLWRILQVVFGATNTLPFHALNILGLIACGWMVGLLAKELIDNSERATTTHRHPFGGVAPTKDLIGWLAGALMTVFPFTALVVPLVASLFHLFVTLLTVSACVCALKYDETRKIGWGIAAVVLAALAPFAHESGLMAGVLMALCLVFRFLQNQKVSLHALRSTLAAYRSTLLIIALSILANLLFLPWWRSVPKYRPEGEFAWVGWESVGQSLVFFFEGLTFPIQFLARPLMGLGWSDILAVVVLGLIALGLAVLGLRNRKWLLFGLAYCFAAALPAIVVLPFSYIIVSPRLMVVTAPGAAILWAVVAVEASHRLAWERWRPVVAAGAAVTVSLIPVGHIVREVHLHQLALGPVQSLVRQLQSSPNDTHLIVNATNWIAPVNLTYALGHEGVEVMPGYITPQLMGWVHTQALYNAEGVTFPLVFPQLKDIYFATWGDPLDWETMATRVRVADHVSLVRYSDSKIELVDVGQVLPAQGEKVVSFADRIWLTDMNIRLEGQAVVLDLDWRVNAASGEDIFANALDCDGNVLGLSGGASMGGIYPIWLWQAGESINEHRYIPLDSLSPAGCYRVELGLFNPADGQRTEAFDANGGRLENDVVVLEYKSR